MNVKIGTYTKKVSKGIYKAVIHEGKIIRQDLIATVDNPTYLASQGSMIYAVVKEGDLGGVVALKDGICINAALEKGAPPCFVSIDKKNQLIYSANYHGGRINTYTYDEKTGLCDHQRIAFTDHSKAHYIQYHPELDEVIVCDLGADKVYFFEVKNQMLHLNYTYDAPEKSGPRHAVVHPKTKRIYVFTELSSEIIVLERTTQGVHVLQTISTLPQDATTTKWGAAIRLSLDGKHLYVSNRGHDSISVFSVESELRLIQNIPSYGVQPRDFNISPDGSIVIVGNLDTNTLTTYHRDSHTGLLTLLQKEIESYEPVCFEFEE